MIRIWETLTLTPTIHFCVTETQFSYKKQTKQLETNGSEELFVFMLVKNTNCKHDQNHESSSRKQYFARVHKHKDVQT